MAIAQSHREAFPEQYSHPRVGQMVECVHYGAVVKVGRIERVTNSRFGEMAKLDTDNEETFRTLASLRPAEKIFALKSAQGTACSETVLYESEYTAPNRLRIEERYCVPGRVDAPVADTWTDVSDNDALRWALFPRGCL